MNKFTLSIFAVPFLLGACAGPGAIAGAGATAGVAAAQEGGLTRAVTDAKIQLQINDLWFKHDLEMFRKLDLTINQGRVLITGVVQNPEHRVDAVRLVWQVEGVKQVINEIRVAESPGLVGMARDAWISGRLRTMITFDRAVQSINYNIDTVEGVIYLMGVAQSQVELNRVIETARTIPDVKQVVSYVKLAGVQSQDYTPSNSTATPSDFPSEENPPADSGYYDQGGYGAAPEPLTSDDYYDPGTVNGGAVPQPVQSEPLPLTGGSYYGGY